jgi:hypothetical protein
MVEEFKKDIPEPVLEELVKRETKILTDRGLIPPLRELLASENFGMACHARRADGSKCPNKAWFARGNELFCREHAPNVAGKSLLGQ